MRSDHFCLAPFVQLTTHPSGSFSPCPYLGGTTWSGGIDSTLQDQWLSLDLESLRQDFLQGKQPGVCYRCWNEENNGKRSLRQRISQYAIFQDPEFLQSCHDDIDTGEYRQGPRVLSIKNGNLCNARCRSCHPEDSTPWILDSHRMHQDLGIVHYKLNIANINWTDAQIDDLVLQARRIGRLELFGGESLYNRQVIKLLSIIIDQGHAHHIDLYINTNGSVNLLDRLPDIHHFRSVDIGVSIDSLPEHFSYVRHPLDIKVIEQNLSEWQQYFDHHGSRYVIQPIVTVSLLNVFYLVEIREYLLARFNRHPFWNLLVDPEHLAIQNLPWSIKHQVIKKIKHIEEFEQFINVMLGSQSVQAWERFAQITTCLDRIRKESLDSTMPEWASILRTYWPQPKVVIFVGDLSQTYQGQYLIQKAKTHDVDACLLKQYQDRCQVNDTIRDSLNAGTYYTGVTMWQDHHVFKAVLAQAHEIWYAPPPVWSDGPESFSTLVAPRGWSRVILEEILSDLSMVHRIDPVDQ